MATSPLPAAQTLVTTARWPTLLAEFAMPWPVVCATMLSVAGVFSIFSTDLYLWDLWRTDPLKSIGGFVPAISLLLILRAWRALGWELRGAWWGLLILAFTVGLVHWRDHAILELILSPSWTIFVPPHSLVAFAYISGAVLLFGGSRLYRAAIFPILLIWLVNPVPHVFNRFVDLPLQHASAVTARAFAQALGQPLTPSQLYLMFTPDFGMFIAPGCNGIRGSVTMGLIALIAGFLYRFRLRVWALVVAGAVLLGYLFNLARLCVLVLYYLAALRLPALQSRAEMADYVIGALLFFFATLLLFAVIRRFSPARDLRPPRLHFAWADAPALSSSQSRLPFWLRWAAFALLAAAGSVSYARGLAQPRSQLTDQAIFPAKIGPYALRRTWQEKLSGGQVIFDWADYAVPGVDAAVSVGVSPVLGAHDTLLCHTARGEDWLWHSSVALPTASGPVNFSASFYNDGATQYIEATTVCSGASCGQYSSEPGALGHLGHMGFVYSRPNTRSLLSQSPSRPIPVLLKVETPDAATAGNAAREALLARLSNFLANASFEGLTKPYRSR